jgi:hypothetical protein
MELRPDVIRHLALQVPHLVRQAALAQGAREALLDGANDARRPVAHHQQRIRQAAPAHVLEELAAARRVLFGAGREVQQSFLAIDQNAPRRQYRLAWLAQMQPLGDPVDEQIHDLELGEIAAGKGLVFGPQALGDLAHSRPAQQRLAALIRQQGLDVPRRKPAGIHLHCQGLQLRRALAKQCANPRPERLGTIRNLRRVILDRPLGALQPAGAVAGAVARSRHRAPGVVAAAKGILGLALKRLLDDQTRRQAHQIRVRLGRFALPSISAFNCSRVRSDAGILSIGVPLRWRPVAKPNLVDSPNQARVYPNPVSSNPMTSPSVPLALPCE